MSIFMLGTPLSLDRHADPARRRGFFGSMNIFKRWKEALVDRDNNRAARHGAHASLSRALMPVSQQSV
jgi:hypothetical protein